MQRGKRLLEKNSSKGFQQKNASKKKITPDKIKPKNPINKTSLLLCGKNFVRKHTEGKNLSVKNLSPK